MTSVLGRSGLAVSRLGVGLAALGRPAYVTLGRDRDLAGDRSPEAMYGRTVRVLDAARAAGVRYVDAARSYGRSEEFLARWLRERGVGRTQLTVGTKWGYRYVADWRIEAAVHEEKELSVRRFRAQLDESAELLGPWLDLHQIHSATVESGCLDDAGLMAALVDARRGGRCRALGLTLSGPRSAETLSRALEVRVDGERVFDVVQATFNLLEPSLAPVLADAHAAGVGVIAKEVFANGRLTEANERPQDAELVARLGALAGDAGCTIDQLAVRFVLSHACVDVALSGAVTVEQLRSHAAGTLEGLAPAIRDRATAFAATPQDYWATRSRLPWQ